MVNLSLKCINAVILLDASGNRVLANYYGSEYTSVKEQKAFEKGLFEKTRLSQGNVSHRTQGRSSSTLFPKLGEIILYDNQVVLYRVSIDVYFYVVGSPEENELILLSMLNTFHDAVSSLLRSVAFSFFFISREQTLTVTFFFQRYQVEKRTLLDNLDLVALCLDETVDRG
jgi:hypothetical protein